MKLHITMDELKAGTKLMRLTQNSDQLEFMAARNMPIAVDPPVRQGNRRISVVLLTRFDRTADKKAEVDFVPIWQRAFTVYHARTNKLRLIVLETESGKLMFDGSNDGKPQPCRFTTEGPGAHDEDADVKLSKMLQEDPLPTLTSDVARYLSSTLVLDKAVA